MGGLLVKWLDEAMPRKIFHSLSMPLEKMIDGITRNMLRILHYPPINQYSSGVRSAPHTDINLLTILPVSTGPGLEILDKKNSWQKVYSEKNAIIVTSADMLEISTSGYYPSALHRVVNPTDPKLNIPRYSMPFFIHPRHDIELKNGLTAKAFWIQRLKEIGLYYDFLCIDKQ